LKDIENGDVLQYTCNNRVYITVPLQKLFVFHTQCVACTYNQIILNK